MKKLLAIILTFSLTLAISVGINSIYHKAESVNTNISYKKSCLVIDAGHGGIDAGTIGVDGTNEKEINLAIAKKLYDFAGVSGLSTKLIRAGDYLVYDEGDDKSRSDLYNRMDYINSVNKATLISIHQNHFEVEKEWGIQIWYSPNDDLSKALADNILSISKDNLQKNNRRENKKSDSSYYLLYKAKVPSVMVECGFMSNNEENKKLKDNDYQNKMAYSIMLGYGNYLSEEL